MNPRALDATIQAASTSAGHHCRSPQLAWPAVTPHSTATHAMKV